mgnify:CR=1 FL=1
MENQFTGSGDRALGEVLNAKKPGGAHAEALRQLQDVMTNNPDNTRLIKTLTENIQRFEQSSRQGL